MFKKSFNFHYASKTSNLLTLLEKNLAFDLFILFLSQYGNFPLFIQNRLITTQHCCLELARVTECSFVDISRYH